MSIEEKQPESRRPDAIVDSRLYVKHDVGHADLRNAAFFADPANRAHLASQFLIYEHVIIPTNDFAVVPALINWMGIAAFEEALDSGAITFLRRLGILGYAGNGLGLQAFGFSDTPEKPYRQWWRRTLFGDPAEAVELHLQYGASSLPKSERERLTGKVLANSRTPDLNKDNLFTKHVENESYTDIKDTPELRTFFSILAAKSGARPGEALAMNRLPGIQPNEMRMETDGEAQDTIQLAIKVAAVNMEIVLADYGGGTDLHVSAGAEKLVAHKILRSRCVSGKLEGFARVLELNRIPDIRTAVESGSLALPDIWRVRQHKSAKLFRQWLSKGNIEAASDLVRLYVESLEQKSMVESLPARVLRFVLTTGIGFINPIAGIGVGVTDSFFLARFLKGYRPKLMFDRLGRLFPENLGGKH